MKRLVLASVSLAVLVACGRSAPSPRDHGGHDHAAGEPHEKESDEPEPWSVTAWGQHFELFPETEPLIAGKVARSHTHVTLLEDFSPMREGTVVAVLRDAANKEEAFAGKFKRDGIYEIEIQPSRQGEFDLAFRIETPKQREEVAAGRVNVGDASKPGGLILQPVTPGGERATSEAGAISFLKEQQWKTEFGTAWVSEGALHGTAVGPARVRPSAGGEVVLTASVDSVVSSADWPYAGRDVAAGAAVFRLIPHTTGTRSLSELEAELRTFEAESAAAANRLERLDGLLRVEAVSQAEVEKARATSQGLEARREAARKDLAAARAARSGAASSDTLVVKAPWAGRIAEISVSPGQSVAAGAPLGRVVKTSPVWLDVALRPEQARYLGSRPEGLYLREPTRTEPIEIRARDVRLVSKSPEVDARTGTVSALFEVNRGAAELPFGTTVEVEIVLPEEQRGIVIPASSIVDDAGVAVAYVQLEGESFVRREVRLRARQGPLVLVDGVKTGERLVTRGAAAIRRAALLSTPARCGRLAHSTDAGRRLPRPLRAHRHRRHGGIGDGSRGARAARHVPARVFAQRRAGYSPAALGVRRRHRGDLGRVRVG
jgi:membrane fusion protein, heavy metal efflux system